LIRDDPQFVNITHLSMGSPSLAWAGYQFASCKDGNCTTETSLLNSLDSGRSWEALPLPPPSSTAFTPTDSFANNLPGSSLGNIQVDLPRTLTTEGQGIDKCEIPTLSQFQAWASYGPYQATNLYFGGVNRACANSAISESYLVDLSTQGWTFIPTWVGPQSRCWNIYSDASRNISTNLTTAHQQGVDEANLAIAKASAIGLTEADKSSTVIYYDLEGFDLPNSGCVNSAKAFISGWTETLNANGNIAGLYGRGGVLNELFAANTPPDVIWPANWLLPAQYRANATVWNVSGLPDSLWSNHQRIRQYAGPHTETWGSVTIQVDSNVIDGVVADISGTFPLKITKSGDGNGTVNSTPGGIGCGNDCIGTYTRFSTVTLTATADSDSVFNSWSGNCTPTGATTCQVTLEAATTVTATFSLIYPKLTIVKNGEGGGTVTSAPVGINCGASCAENFNLQQVVELTAHPDDVSHLKTWSANCAVTGTNTCQVTMDTTKSVTTTFEWNSYPVNVNKSGNGSGTVTSNPSGINCGTDCQEAYKYNNLVTLTATPASGSAFTGWTGPCTVNGDYTCQVTVDKVNDVTATFMLGYLLTVTRNGNGSGTVISSPAGITCGTDCSSDFARNTTITLTATPTPGSFFSGWGGACAGTTTLTCQVSMDSARQVTISFNTIYLFMPWTRKN
jgi:hypothetical protein